MSLERVSSNNRIYGNMDIVKLADMDTDRNIHNQHKKKHTHKHKHTERRSSRTQTQANACSLSCELSVQDFMDIANSPGGHAGKGEVGSVAAAR